MTAELRIIKVDLGSTISVIGDDGPPPWIGNPCITGALLAYITLEQHLTPWTRQSHEKTWDIAAVIELAVPLKIPSELLPRNLSIERVDVEHCMVSKLLLVQRYPDCAWADDCVVFVFGIPDEEQIETTSVLAYSEWCEKTVPLTTHSIFKVGKCQ